MKRYTHLCYAGTFDRLHIGHKKLIDLAFELGERVSMGLTTERLYKNKLLSQTIEPFETRKKSLESYLRRKNCLARTRFFRLDDIYGTAIVDKTMDSILVTKLTRPNAEKINKIRMKKRLATLDIIVAPLVRGEDGEVITSERIRMGETDRKGQNFQFSIFNFQKKTLILPEYLRKELRKPLGLVIKSQIPNPNFQTNSKSQFPNKKTLKATAEKVVGAILESLINPPVVITVGDIVTLSMLKVGFDPDVKIIDLRSRRQKISNFQFPTNEPDQRSVHGPIPSRLIGTGIRVSKQIPNPNFQTYKIINQPGTINLQAVKAIKKSFKNFLMTRKKQLIIVKGEEDLLALPAILLAPLQSIVLYGQMDLGVVAVEVTEEKKKEVEKIVGKFI